MTNSKKKKKKIKCSFVNRHVMWLFSRFFVNTSTLLRKLTSKKASSCSRKRNSKTILLMGLKSKLFALKFFFLFTSLLFLELSVTWLVLDNFQVLSSCKKQDHFLLLKFTNDGDINNKWEIDHSSKFTFTHIQTIATSCFC